MPLAVARTAPRLAAAMMLMFACVIAGGGAPRAEEKAGAPIGSGDRRIHVIPSLSPYSVKNGETLTVTAVVRSARTVASVEADLAGLATVTLQPNARLGGVSADGTTGIWTAEWIAAGLEEKVYAATLTVTDIDGHAWTDHSLLFSDPAAGNSTPGSTNYPDGGMMRVGGLVIPDNETISSAVVDADAGYAYFGSQRTPGQVLKVGFGTGSNPPTRVGTAILDTGETSLYSGVIDAAAGYAYFAAGNSSGLVVKVALGEGNAPPTRVGVLKLDPGDSFFSASCAVIDPVAGYAYFGTGSSPSRVVKVALGEGDAPPTRVGAVALATGEGFPRSAVIDTAAGYAWFGTSASPGRVVKVALGEGDDPPTRVGAVVLDAGENALRSAVSNPADGYAYFGTSTSPGRVVKVALGEGDDLPTRVGAVVLDAGENDLRSAVIYPADGYAYFGTSTSPGRVVKVALGEGDDPPTRIGALTLDEGESAADSAVRDATGHALFATFARIVKVAPSEGTAPPTRVSATTLADRETYFSSAVIDAAAGYAYFGTGSAPYRVVKVALGEVGHPPLRVGAVTVGSYGGLVSAVIDTAAGYAYFGTMQGRVVKVALTEGVADPRLVGALTLDDGEDRLRSAVIDAAAGYAYFGAGYTTGHVVKVALGEGDALPMRVGAVTLDDGERLLFTAVIDATAGFALFGTYTTPGRVVKVALGAGDDSPSRVGAVVLESGEDNIKSAVIDTDAGYAYFGTDTSWGRVVKVALGEGNAPPVRVGAVTLDGPSEGSLGSAVIDTADGHAYFASDDSTISRVIKVALGTGSDPPARVGSIYLGSWERYLSSAVIDSAAGLAYFGVNHEPSRVSKVALNHRNQLQATRFTLPERGAVTDVRFYSHAASGNVILALYDDADPKQLVWESGIVPNTAAGEFLVVPIADGTPSKLLLEPGNYWAAWQVDTPVPVASWWTHWLHGVGFVVIREFGPAPATLPAEKVTATTHYWTYYITYDAFFDPNHSAIVMR